MLLLLQIYHNIFQYLAFVVMYLETAVSHRHAVTATQFTEPFHQYRVKSDSSLILVLHWHAILTLLKLISFHTQEMSS
jgi:hypothetical protein